MKKIGQTHIFFMAIILNLDSKDMTAEMVTPIWGLDFGLGRSGYQNVR